MDPASKAMVGQEGAVRSLAIFIAFLASAGCGARTTTPSDGARRAYAELVVPPSECRTPGPANLNPSQVRADIDRLRRLFARAYAGYDRIALERWNTAFEGLGTAAAVRTPSALRDLLAQELQFVDDNHVGFWSFEPERTFRSTSGHAAPYISEALDAEHVPSIECATPDAQVVPAFGNGGVERRLLVLSRQPMNELRCTQDGEARIVPLQALSLEHEAGAVFEERDTHVPWVRLRSLMTSHAGALEGFVESAPRLAEAPVAVVDLRHTGGGSDRYLRRFFAAFSTEPLRYWETGRLSSEAMLQGALNFWSCVRAGGSHDDEGRAWLDRRIERARREIERDLHARGPYRDVVENASSVQPARDEAYTGRLIVVVDRGCQSACETAVLLARQIPGALIVGENTGGVMKVGELRWYRLPHSRVWVSLGHRRHDDPEGAFREAFGFLPDLWLTSSRTEEGIGQLARCFADPRCASSIEHALEPVEVASSTDTTSQANEPNEAP